MALKADTHTSHTHTRTHVCTSHTCTHTHMHTHTHTHARTHTHTHTRTHTGFLDENNFKKSGMRHRHAFDLKSNCCYFACRLGNYSLTQTLINRDHNDQLINGAYGIGSFNNSVVWYNNHLPFCVYGDN